MKRVECGDKMGDSLANNRIADEQNIKRRIEGGI
jgi:hypothetical protein